MWFGFESFFLFDVCMNMNMKMKMKMKERFCYLVEYSRDCVLITLTDGAQTLIELSYSLFCFLLVK